MAFSGEDSFRQAIASFQTGRLGDAERLFKEVLRHQPKHIAALNLLSVVLTLLKRYAEAEVYIKSALKLNSNSDTTLYNYAIILKSLNRPSEALERFNQALSINATIAETWNNRGTVLNDLKRYDDAILDFDKAISLRANYSEAFCNKGKSLAELKRYDEGLAACDKALSLKPDFAEAWIGRGIVFYDLKRYDEAIAAYDKALALKPDLEGAWLGRGNVFFSLNRNVEALTCFDKVIALKKDSAEGYWNKSLLKLSLGEYEEGWQLYEWRWKSRLFTSPVRNFSQRLWLGNDNIAGKIILVHSEQGFGDTIQFYRYLLKLKELGCEIVFETQVPLVPLIKAQKNICQVISQGETLPSFDVHCPLLSLPLAFKTTLETIPEPIPYLFPPPEKLELWRTILGPKNKPRIGFAWSGNPQHANDIRRSLPLELLLPIINSAAEWHSLQKDVRESDRNSLKSNPTIIDHARSLNDFSDTAALIAELDLVISIDTAVAHLAGALGKPEWILLPFHPDFRWVRDREDCPWYPTARLFRQTEDGEWGSVIDRVSQELKIFLAAS